MDDTTDKGTIKGKPNPNSGLVWEFVQRGDKFDDRMHRTMSSVAIDNSLVIAPDSSGLVHCLDAKTGKKYWSHDGLAGIKTSPLIADGKVYLPNDDGDVMILGLAKKKNLLAQRQMNQSIESSPVVAGGVLYVMTRGVLYAIQNKQ